MESTIYINNKINSIESSKITLPLKGLKILLMDIPLTLFEKIPCRLIKLVCYNLWTLLPTAVGFIPYLLYQKHFNNCPYETVFANLVFPIPHSNKNIIENKLPFIKKNIDGITFYSIHASGVQKNDNKEAKTIIFLPGRHGNFQNNEEKLTNLYHKKKCNIITWDPRTEKDAISFSSIPSKASIFLKYLYTHHANLEAKDTIFYAYSLGGAFLSEMLTKDLEIQTKFKGSTIVADRCFQSLDTAVDEFFQKSLLMQWAFNTFCPEVNLTEHYKNTNFSNLIEKQDFAILHLTAKNDYSVSESVSLKNISRNQKHATQNTSVAFNTPSKKAIVLGLISATLTVIFFSAALVVLVTLLIGAYLAYTNKNYFNTHEMPYGFNNEQVCSLMKL